MYHFEFPFSDVPQFSFKDKFYQFQTEELKDFIDFYPNLEEIKDAILKRQSFDIDRKLLHDFLSTEYLGVEAHDNQTNNINYLKSDNTFTVSTAHQPCLFGGPAYYFYKIFSTIHLADLLNKTYPEYRFVPVFVNGGEDHDFDEVNHLNVFGKRVEWKTDQKGSVGRFTLDGLNEALDEFKDILGENNIGQLFISILEDALKNSVTYNDFVFRWVNDYFKKWGLLVVSMDNRVMKTAFKSLMKKELLQMPSHNLVEDAQNRLTTFGFKPQAHAREINLFYLGNGFRERIIFENEKYIVNNTELSFSEEEILHELNDFPENFSPNVILRPLFQETVLPDIAFVCGGGEVAYWIERKSQFEYFGIFYPMIIRRNSAWLVHDKVKQNVEKLGLSLQVFIQGEHDIIHKYLEMNSSTDLDLTPYRDKIHILVDEIQLKTKDIDPTLEGYIGKEGQNMIRILDNMESRLVKALKNKESIQLNKISNIHSKLHPNGGLQERSEHFIQFAMGSSKDLSEYLVSIFNPFKKEYLVIIT